MLPRGGYQLERQANYAVALKLDLDEELLREGAAREVVHAIQNARKGAGLQVEDRIELTLFGDDALLEAVREHADYVAGETLAASLTFDGAQAEGAAHGDRPHRRLRARDRAAARRLDPALALDGFGSGSSGRLVGRASSGRVLRAGSAMSAVARLLVRGLDLPHPDLLGEDHDGRDDRHRHEQPHDPEQAARPPRRRSRSAPGAGASCATSRAG